MNSSFKTGTPSHTSEPDDSGIVFNEKKIVEGPRLDMNAPLKKTTVKSGNVFDVSKVFEDENIETGMIVTDKKGHGDSLSTQLHAAFREWWSGTKESVHEAVQEATHIIPQEEDAVIPSAETRADVVKEATSLSSLAPKDDHHVVIEKIRTFKHDVAKISGTSVVVKEPKKKTHGGWSHLIDTPEQKVQISAQENLKNISKQSESKENIHAQTSPKITVADIQPAKQAAPKPSSQINTAARVVEQKIKHSSVPRVETRANVVKEATSLSSLAPKDDHHVVIEKIRTFKHDVAKANGTAVVAEKPIEKENVWGSLVGVAEQEIAIPKIEPALVEKNTSYEADTKNTQKEITFKPEVQPEKNDGVWSHIIADNAPQVAIAPIVETRIEKNISEFNVPKQHKEKIDLHKISEEIHMQRKAFTAPAANVAHEDTPLAPQVEQPVSQAAPKVESPSAWVSEPVEQPIEEELPPQKTPEPAPIIVRDSITEPAFHSTTTVQISEERPIEEEIVSAIPTSIPKESSGLFRTILRYGMFFGVTLCGIGLALVVSVHFNLFSTTTNTPSEPIPIVTTGEKPKLMLSGTREEFLTNLQTLTIQSSPGFSTFEPLVGADGSARVATTQEILTFLSVHLDEKTMRNLNSSMTLGSITTTKNEPFIILTSTNFDLLFTGLLGWERYIDTDLAPLFGAPQSDDIYFTDAVRGNASTRILYNTSHEEVMLYSFINQHTVVITTSSEALSKIIERF